MALVCSREGSSTKHEIILEEWTTFENPWVHTFQPLVARFVCKVPAEVMPMILFPAVRQPGPQELEDRNELFVLQHGYSKYIYVPKTNVY